MNAPSHKNGHRFQAITMKTKTIEPVEHCSVVPLVNGQRKKYKPKTSSHPTDYKFNVQYRGYARFSTAIDLSTRWFSMFRSILYGAVDEAEWMYSIRTPI